MRGVKSRPEEFTLMQEYAERFGCNVSSVDKVSRRIIKEQRGMAATCSPIEPLPRTVFVAGVWKRWPRPTRTPEKRRRRSRRLTSVAFNVRADRVLGRAEAVRAPLRPVGGAGGGAARAAEPGGPLRGAMRQRSGRADPPSLGRAGPGSPRLRALRRRTQGELERRAQRVPAGRLIPVSLVALRR